MLEELKKAGIDGPLDALRVARRLVQTVWDPTRADIQHGTNRLMMKGLADTPLERIRDVEERHPDLARMFESGYDPDLRPEDLERLPDGSLGREYARFIRANEIDPLQTLLAMGTPGNLLEYHFKRAYKLHDLMHVVLGADATVLGEVKIVSFSLGQARDASVRAPAMALAVLFMNTGLRRHHQMPEAVRLAAKWMAIGEDAPWHVAVPVEDYLDRPVAELRDRMLPATALA